MNGSMVPNENYGLENIGKAMVRNEFKLWMYSHFLLPSKRFLLTIHRLTDTQLKSLDTLTDKAIKSWAGLPPSATNALIHMPEGLDVKAISELYKEVHTVSHTRTRLKGDPIVNSVIDATIQENLNTHVRRAHVLRQRQFTGQPLSQTQ